MEVFLLPAKLLAASGRELRRALFSLKQIFQVSIFNINVVNYPYVTFAGSYSIKILNLM